MSAFQNLAQMVFGDLLALRREPSRGTVSRWLCKCYCGNMKVVDATKLKTGHTKSCGCYRDKFMVKHGEASKKRSSEYGIWAAMIQRCTRESHPSYSDYGGRGIKVCDRWRHSFENFLEDMGRRPSPELSLDRFPNNDGGYYKENCRWGTEEQQARNRRNNVWFEHNGIRKVVTDWARELDVADSCITRRIKKGKSFADVYAYLSSDRYIFLKNRRQEKKKNKNK